ncbi:MAG TPA: ATP-binding cassette domain-containing protein [Candidatus Limnocylindrales bacterium]|nr:ATP-binding cassette domain-containing protein [Candidatus Limnocylindrales bacterium]
MNVDFASFDPSILLLIVPLLVLQLGLMVAAVVDLLRDERAVRGGSKPMWAVIIVFVNLIGPILYFLVGRVDAVVDSTPGPGAMPGWGSPHDPPIVVGPGAAPGAPRPVPAPRPEAEPVAAPGRPALADGPVAIAIEGLAKRYPGGVLALDGLSMTVPAGSVFGLLGPNGAGKTTCLRLLAGMTRPTAGRAIVNGMVVATDALAVRQRLGYLEQDPRAYGWMTGREQLTMLGRLHGLEGAALASAVSRTLARVDLADAADRRTGTYSGGMRQRLGIAGALVHRPPVIVLDEPVSALDPEGRRDVLELIVSLRGEATVLFSTHVLADVERICDRVGILDHGRLVVEGPLAELLDRYALPVYRVEAEPGQAAAVEALAARLRGLDWVTGLAIDHGLLTVAVADPSRAARELLPAISDEGVAVVAVARARPTLEDVFLRLTGDGREAAA